MFIFVICMMKKIIKFSLLFLVCLVYSHLCVWAQNSQWWTSSSSTNETWMTMSDLWLYMNTWCLVNGQCGMNIYKMLWIRKSNENPTVSVFAQDVILAATTFIGTVITAILIICGLMYSIRSITGKDVWKTKNAIIGCLVWLLFVMGAYTIIRLIQFIATWWS